MACLENLKKRKSFTKNDPRINKKGRPPKLPDLDELLATVLGKESKGKTEAQLIIEAIQAKAKKGDVRAAEVLLERGWGKVAQQINAEINGEITEIRRTVITKGAK